MKKYTIFIILVSLIIIGHNINVLSTEIKIDNNQYEMVIISPKKFSNHLEPLVIHKNNKGINTIIKNIEDIYEEYNGKDEAEQLKIFIKDAYEKYNIKYVLLVGGRRDQSALESWWIPVRYSHLDRRYGNMIERKFISDLYFADIIDENGNFSSWDTDNDGIFGEWPEDKGAEDIPNLYPDVYVGRLPCRNILDVKIMVNKIINYEKDKCSDSWFKNMVVVAGDTYPGKTDYIDGELYTQMGLDMMPDFNPIKLWTSDGSLKNWVDVVKAINSGCGFIWFSGHGNPKLWGTHPPYDSKTWIYGLRIRQIPFLLNGEKLPICIDGSGCFNSMFNVSLGYSPWVSGLPIPKCWSWALTSKINGGSIATIGSTAFSYESPDINTWRGGIEWLDMTFFYEYGQNNTDILGETWGNTIKDFLHNFTINWNDKSHDGDALIVKNVEMWLLIGDPSLKIGGYS